VQATVIGLLANRPKAEASVVLIYLSTLCLEAYEIWRPCVVAHAANAQGRPCVLTLLLTRMRMLATKSSSSSPVPSSWSWTALALLPTCPAPALSTLPVCYGMHALRCSVRSIHLLLSISLLSCLIYLLENYIHTYASDGECTSLDVCIV
jgi:hypothetical protein